MSIIIPAIIPQSKRDLKAQLDSVPSATHVQIDVVDGQFVPPVSWPYQNDIRHFDWEDAFTTSVGVDLMVCDALVAGKEWLDAGAERLIVHVESVSEDDIAAFLALRAERDFELALSCNNDTPLSRIARYLPNLDFVQLMGIGTIGSQGQPFDERVLGRITALKAEHPSVVISIDGSVNQKTLPRLQAAGADRFVVGSAVVKQPNPDQAYQDLTEFLNTL